MAAEARSTEAALRRVPPTRRSAATPRRPPQLAVHPRPAVLRVIRAGRIPHLFCACLLTRRPMHSSKDLAKRLRFDRFPGRDFFRRHYMIAGSAAILLGLGAWAALYRILG